MYVCTSWHLRATLPPPPLTVVGTMICFVTPWGWVLEKLTGSESRYSSHFMEPEGSLQHSEVPAILFCYLCFEITYPSCHITKRDVDSCFGRQIMNSVIRIGLQVWKGSCELLRTLKTCLRAPVQTGPGSHPTSCTVGNGSLSRG